MVAYLLIVAGSPVPWEFSLEVDTEVAELRLQPDMETRWLIDGAVVCSRTRLQLPEIYRLPSGGLCGSRAWAGWRITQPEQVLLLRGGAAVVMEFVDGRLAASLRSETEESLGTVSVTGVLEGVELGSAINLIWPLDALPVAGFPFTGATTIGRAVSWSDPRMLRGGRVAVYSADQSADQRTLVDEAELMLGDQVQLGDESSDIWPKGFVRFTDREDQGPLQVVAFGRADSLKISRYGDNGYDFRPDYLSKLATDPGVAFWGSLLVGFIGLVVNLAGFTSEGMVRADREHLGRYRYLRWLLKYSDS